MKRALYLCLAGLSLALLRFMLVPYAGLAADLLLIFPPFLMWLAGDRRRAAWLLTVSCILADALSPNPYPVVTLASLLAGSGYVLIFEPFISSDNTLTRALAAFLWLAAWRGALVGVLWASVAWGGAVLAPHAPAWTQVGAWFAGAGVLWALAWAARRAAGMGRYGHGAAG